MTPAEPLPRMSASPSRGRAPLMVLFVTVFVDLLGFGIVIPFLPMYAARMGIGAFHVGLILSIYSLMQLVAAPVLGRLSDQHGRRPIIMLGLLGSSLGYFIYGFADSFATLLIARAVHGICAGTVSTAQAYIADTTTESERARGMGMIGAAFGLGFVVGPAIGGLLGAMGLRIPVFFAAAITLSNLIFAAIALPEPERRRTSTQVSSQNPLHALLILPHQLVRHRMARFFTIAFLATFAMAMFETTFAIMAPARYGYGTAAIGGLFAYAGVIQVATQGYLLGKIVKRFGEKRLIVIGMAMFAIGMAPLASFSSRAVLFILLAALSLGYSLANPSIASLISKRTGRDLQGEALGVNQSALALARVIGPIVAGLMYGSTGPVSAYLTGGAVALAALIFAGEIDQGGTRRR